MQKDFSKLRESFYKFEAELAVTTQFNNVLRNQMILFKRKSWSNEQYSSRESLQVFGIPGSVTDRSLEETALSTF